MEKKDIYVDKIFDLAKLSFAFARINRATHHEDGIRQESDTDHTFMLSLVASSLAEAFYKEKLDIGLISQFATVHDLVEVYAGDTNSFINVSEESKQEKKNRELKSLQKIKEELNPQFAWATNLIEKYEKQEEIEARFVYLVDKILPELTHVLSNFSYIKNSGQSKEYFYSFIKNKTVFLEEKYGKEFGEILNIYKSIVEKMFNKYESLEN